MNYQLIKEKGPEEDNYRKLMVGFTKIQTLKQLKLMS